MYHKQVHNHFTADQAWILLKDIPKFKKLSGKAKNGQPSHTSGFESRSPDTLSPTETSNSNVPAGATKSKDWERPLGIHQAKRKVTEDEYKQKKMKLLESLEKQSAKRTLEAIHANEEATQANNIQAEWVALDQEKNEMTLMFQGVNACTDKYAQAYLLAKKKSILDHLMNGGDTSNRSVQRSSRASNQRTSRPPTSENEGTSRPPLAKMMETRGLRLARRTMMMMSWKRKKVSRKRENQTAKATPIQLKPKMPLVQVKRRNFPYILTLH
ncbi:hypothetical protein PTTG_28275 [Puccinia triticina 1-1 BBBD Race 1]|uniref:NAM-associated domain-containing protein n=1 Tax=Puccinia triticina (isolate 1-1 / race 1 (BBBD)) TaxID=630390 RepID=A0A180GD07_PUCT1|nr:hypothetical protein PTTG_28275 [Puccinia triticina 1-1 BBBD Race 1]